MSEVPVLRLRGVRRVFGTFVALEGIDLELGRGQVFGFLGPNGAGKTTTLRMVAGLLQPTAGTIEVCGYNTASDQLECKRRIGFISDRPFLYEKLTGAEFLRFVGGLWGMKRAAILERSHHWMERFDMLGWLGEPVESYSHGMRQRLLLCSALIHAPDLLIMDEPMVGLDPRGAAMLKRVVRELAEEQGMAVVLSTHTLEVVEQICDTVAIINRGKVVASGTLEAIRASHHTKPGQLEELFLRLTEQKDEGAGEGGEGAGNVG
jgi:ABC-2 type transport system ATP-binding protein